MSRMFEDCKFYIHLLCVLITIMLMINKQNLYSQQPDTLYYLPVKHEQQEMTSWCWAAVRSMLMNTLGIPTSQSSQANIALNRSDCDMNPNCDTSGDVNNDRMQCKANNDPIFSADDFNNHLKNSNFVVTKFGADECNYRHFYIINGICKTVNGSWYLIHDPLINCPTIISSNYHDSSFFYGKIDYDCYVPPSNQMTRPILKKSKLMLYPGSLNYNNYKSEAFDWCKYFMRENDINLLSYLQIEQMKIKNLEAYQIINLNYSTMITPSFLQNKILNGDFPNQEMSLNNCTSVGNDNLFLLRVRGSRENDVMQLIAKLNGQVLEIMEFGKKLISDQTSFPTRIPSGYQVFIIYSPNSKSFAVCQINADSISVNFQDKVYNLNHSDKLTEFNNIFFNN